MIAYTVILSPDPEAGGFTVTCPAMPGAITEGDTREAALVNAAEAMGLWLEVWREQGEPDPIETDAILLAGIADALSIRAELGWDTTLETATVRLEPALAA